MFKKKEIEVAKKPALTAEKQIEKEQNDLKKINLIKTRPDSFFLEHFELIQSKLNVKSSYVENMFPEYKGYYIQVIEGFAAIESTFMDIDRKELNQSHALHLYDMLFVTGMMSIVNHYSSYLASGDMKTAFKGNIKKTNGDEGTWAPIEGQITFYLKQFNSVHDINLMNSRIRAGVPESSLRAKIKNAALDKRLSAIIVLQQELSKKENADDHAHFLEEVEKSYLPDALSMYAQFAGADEDKVKAADEILSDQFSLIEGHLNVIRNSHLEQALSEMRMHTSFLRARTETEPQKVIDFAKLSA